MLVEEGWVCSIVIVLVFCIRGGSMLVIGFGVLSGRW